MPKTTREIYLEINSLNHLEHYKYSKDLHHCLPLDHPKREKMDRITNELVAKINKVKAE